MRRRWMQALTFPLVQDLPLMSWQAVCRSWGRLRSCPRQIIPALVLRVLPRKCRRRTAACEIWNTKMTRLTLIIWERVTAFRTCLRPMQVLENPTPIFLVAAHQATVCPSSSSRQDLARIRWVLFALRRLRVRMDCVRHWAWLTLHACTTRRDVHFTTRCF